MKISYKKLNRGLTGLYLDGVYSGYIEKTWVNKKSGLTTMKFYKFTAVINFPNGNRSELVDTNGMSAIKRRVAQTVAGNQNKTA